MLYTCDYTTFYMLRPSSVNVTVYIDRIYIKDMPESAELTYIFCKALTFLSAYIYAYLLLVHKQIYRTSSEDFRSSIFLYIFYGSLCGGCTISFSPVSTRHLPDSVEKNIFIYIRMCKTYIYVEFIYMMLYIYS